MSENSISDCLICRKQRGDFYVPGGAIYMDDLVYCTHADLSQYQPDIYLGWLTVGNAAARTWPGRSD